MGPAWERELGLGVWRWGGESQSHHCGSWLRRGPWVSLLGGKEDGIPMLRPLPSLKLECEKLASEKTEMQRHYVMVRGLSYWVGGSGEDGLSVS